jgi:CRP/FNR family cyclic AMP-dependent transcriptional regulator
MESLERLLREHPFLRTMPDRHLEFMTGCAANLRFTAGQLLFKEGDPADAAYLVRDGRVALEIHAPGAGSTQIATIERGQVFGWSWLFPPYRWNFDARAIETVRAITFNGECLRGKCEADHDLGYELLKRFLQEIDRSLARAHLQLLDMYRANP